MASPQEFAQQYGPQAATVGKAIGVDPSVLLGQWGLETGWGRSVIPGTNNLGNIKDVAGGGVAAVDNMTGSNDKYRAYDSADAFGQDFAGLINRRYQSAMNAGTDAQAYAKALKAGGYAEDPDYERKLVAATDLVRRSGGLLDRAAQAILPSAQAASTFDSKIKAAKEAGYSDSEIMQHLGQTKGFADRLAKARASGYTDAEIFEHLGLPNPGQEGGAITSRGPDGVMRIEMGGTNPTAQPVSDNSLVALGAGLGSGVGQVALGAQEWLGRGMRGLGMERAGNWLVDDAQAGRKKLAGEVAPYKEVSPWAAGGGELAGNIAATLPVGGVLGRGVSAIAPNLGRVAPQAEKLANALRSGGMNLGGTPATTLAGQAGNLATRMVGGAGTGAVSAGLVDPNAVGTGAVVGALLPPTLLGASKAAGAAGAALQPFFSSGQRGIVGNTLRGFADNPQAASSALKYSTEIVPGSAPTTAMASGDAGLAALSRSMQGSNLEYAGQLAARQTAQNQARTAALEAIAGNPGKIATAKAARDALTAPMRESVLDAAGQVPSESLLRSIDRLITNPSNAGKLSQQALNEFKGRIAQFTQDGAIDARALYAIRKDIGDVLGGKLQGEAGNIRYASSQLIKVRELIDDAIDKASRSVKAPGTAVMPYGPNIERAGMAAPASQGPRTSWKEYLKTYADESMPINQMEKLDDVLKRIQNSRVDQRGSLELSGAKLNNILKNEGADLAKVLSPDQMALLRNLSADLNASQLAESAGRMVGSSTFQNLAQNNLMTQALGRAVGGSTPVQATLGRLLQLPYGMANQGIQEKLAEALLNPRQAASLLADPKNSRIIEALTRISSPAARSAPVISAQ